MKVKYTKDQIRFILDNWIKNEEICIKQTGHSRGSIKLMLQKIAATYGLVNFSEGNPVYSEVADEFRKNNKVFDKEMTKKSFCMRFGIIK